MIPLGILGGSVVTEAAGFTTITDSFNRADNASTLGTADTGQAWSGTGTWGILGNAARCVATNDTWQTVETGLSDGYVATVTLVSAGDNKYPGIQFRHAASNHWYGVIFQPGSGIFTGIYLARNLSGSITVPGGVSTIPGGVGPGAVLELTVTDESGNTRIVAKVNGVERLNRLETTAGRPAGTRVGIRGQAAAYAQFDNFSVAEA